MARLPGSVHVVVVQMTKYRSSRDMPCEVNTPLSSVTLNFTNME